jgi:hypothetical protein
MIIFPQSQHTPSFHEVILSLLVSATLLSIGVRVPPGTDHIQVLVSCEDGIERWSEAPPPYPNGSVMEFHSRFEGSCTIVLGAFDAHSHLLKKDRRDFFANPKF